MARCAAGGMQDVRLTCPSRAAWHLTLRRQHGRGLEQPNDGPACPPLAWVPPSLAEDFMGSRGSITEGSAKLQQYPCRRFTPWQKTRKPIQSENWRHRNCFLTPQGEDASMRCDALPQHGESAKAQHPAQRIANGRFLICKQHQLRQTASKAPHPPPTGPHWCQASHPHLQQQITTMSVERRVASDRRSGKDRRETEAGPPPTLNGGAMSKHGNPS